VEEEGTGFPIMMFLTYNDAHKGSCLKGHWHEKSVSNKHMGGFNMSRFHIYKFFDRPLKSYHF
jgi:hypothetical protein